MPKKILILSANPKTTPYLRLDEELREIEAGLERSRKREQFQLVAKWAVRPRDLCRTLLDEEPHILHFSGHGEGELSLENDAGEVQPVSNQSLARLFKLFDKTECILLNACYSAEQARVLRHCADYIIGMNAEVSDRGALRFSQGFYDALGAGRGYADAFEFGRAAMDLEGGGEEVAIPRLFRREQASAPDPVGKEFPPESPRQTAERELAEELQDKFERVMQEGGLSQQVRARDEFSRHNSGSLRLMQEALDKLKRLPAKAEFNHVMLMAGIVLQSAGGLEEAERLFEQARDQAQNDYECALACFNLFQVRLRGEKREQALADLKAAVKLDPERYALHDTEKYPIEKILGAGGMGCVFLCTHRLQRRRVAVKCFWECRKGKPEKVFKEAFFMRDIASAYVPEPLDYGYADPLKQERAFFVSEYIDGAMDGETWLKRHGPLDLERGLQVALEIAKGLQAAHKAGICHLDFKPANLLLKMPPADNRISIKIIDFGLARAGESLALEVLSVQRSRAVGLSALGRVMFGTFDYAAPEQQGYGGKPGPKSDVFSFGATLYRLFTNDNPRFPRSRKLPDLPELQDLLMDCLEQQPQQRPAVAEIIHHLQNTLKQLQAGRKAKQAAEVKAEEEERKKGKSRARAEETKPERRVRQEVKAAKEPPHRQAGQAEPGKKPAWADILDRDEYGLFADFSFEGVIQRMRWIKPGRFMMGSPESEPERRDNERLHEVTLSCGFWLADTACTQALWQAVMGENPSRFKGNEKPVENVSWDDVMAFIRKLNEKVSGLELRLPAEAEWEYACRAGT
ncbi:MAG: SUMF1/EgtB/PvdO family nonheme iron enzyme, partial [Gammaproteobacteria bacterium]|nr:SUMF1/EgtB/PvdO family nonheme iron enzyme [Gammaproteobacteria bacterium]